MVSGNIGIYLHDVFDIIRSYWKTRRGSVLCTLARNNFIVRNSNPSKKNIMSIGFFIFGGIIFAIYVYLTVWNIFYSSKKQRQENYSTIAKKDASSFEKKIESLFIKNKAA